jgi:hypothetical protein
VADVTSAGGLRRNRDYLLWASGETLSMFGTSLSTFAYPLLILFTTGSAAQTGIVAAAGNIGSLLTLLVGGAMVDRYSRRAILIVGPLLQAAIVASVAIAVAAGHVVLVHVAAAGLADGAIIGVTSGASRAALRRLVPVPDYPAATSALWARDMGVRISAPPVGGVLFTVARALPFSVDAVSYFAAVIGVVAIRRPLGPEHDETKERASLLSSMIEGLRYLGTHPYLRFVTWWSGVMNMLGGGLMLLVILSVRDLGGGPTVIGGTQAIGAVGGLVGATISSRVMRRVGGRTLVIALSWVMGLAALAMAVVGSPWGIGALLGVVTLIAVPLNVVLDTYEMQIIPDALLGRVGNALNLAANGFRWLAPITVGVVVDATSPAVATAIWGGALLSVAAVVQFNRSLHLLERPIEQVAAESATPSVT